MTTKEETDINIRKLHLLANKIFPIEGNVNNKKDSGSNEKIEKSDASANSVQFVALHNEIRYLADHRIRNWEYIRKHQKENDKELSKAYRHSKEALSMSFPLLSDLERRLVMHYEQEHRKNAHILIKVLGIKPLVALRKNIHDIKSQYNAPLQKSAAQSVNAELAKVLERKRILTAYCDAFHSREFSIEKTKYYVTVIGTWGALFFIIYKTSQAIHINKETLSRAWEIICNFF